MKTHIHVNDLESTLKQIIQTGSPLKDLEDLTITGSGEPKIENLAGILRKFQDLRTAMYVSKLKFCHCEIESLEDNTFSPFYRLTSLDLSACKLKSISPGAFLGLDSLNDLNLSDNSLTTIPEKLFENGDTIKTGFSSNRLAGFFR